MSAQLSFSNALYRSKTVSEGSRSFFWFRSTWGVGSLHPERDGGRLGQGPERGANNSDQDSRLLDLNQKLQRPYSHGDHRPERSRNRRGEAGHRQGDNLADERSREACGTVAAAPGLAMWMCEALTTVPSFNDGSDRSKMHAVACPSTVGGGGRGTLSCQSREQN